MLLGPQGTHATRAIFNAHISAQSSPCLMFSYCVLEDVHSEVSIGMYRRCSFSLDSSINFNCVLVLPYIQCPYPYSSLQLPKLHVTVFLHICYRSANSFKVSSEILQQSSWVPHNISQERYGVLQQLAPTSVAPSPSAACAAPNPAAPARCGAGRGGQGGMCQKKAACNNDGC